MSQEERRAQKQRSYQRHKADRLEYMRTYYQANKDRWAGRHRQTRYGITDEQYNEMVVTQMGLCAICGATPERLVVDHDHNSGQIRGLLCVRCNSALHWVENTDWFAKATSYLRRNPQ